MKIIGILFFALLVNFGIEAQTSFQVSEAIPLKNGASRMYPALSGSVWLMNSISGPEKLGAAIYDGTTSIILSIDLKISREDHTNFEVFSSDDGTLWLVSVFLDKKSKKVRYYAGTLNEDGTTGEVKEIWNTDMQNKMNDGLGLYKSAESPDGNLFLISTGTESAVFDKTFNLKFAVDHKLDKLSAVLHPAVANNGDFAFVASTYESAVSMDGAQTYSVIHYSNATDKIVSTNLARFKISNMAGGNEASIIADDSNNFIAIMAGHKNGLKAVVNELSIVKISSKDQSISANLHKVDLAKSSIDCVTAAGYVHDPISLKNGYVGFFYGGAAIWYFLIDSQLNVTIELTTPNVVHPYFTTLGNGIQTGNMVEVYSNANKEMVSKVVGNNKEEYKLSDIKDGGVMKTTLIPGETKKVEILNSSLPEDILFSKVSWNGVRTSKGLFFLAEKKIKPVVVLVK